jgi:hypothetical protein
MIENLNPSRGYAPDGTITHEGPLPEWDMMEKINEIIHQVNTLTLDMYWVLRKLKEDYESTEETR